MDSGQQQWTAVDYGRRRSETAANRGDKWGGFDGMVIAGSGGVDGVDGWLLSSFFLTRS